MSSALFLSQELFDETVLENESVFELSPQEAVDETLSQYSNYSLLHLVPRHPNDDDTRERDERLQFKTAVTVVKSESDDEEAILQALTIIRECCCTANPQAYLILLQHYQAMPALVSLFNKSETSGNSVLQHNIQTLICILTPSKSSRNVQSELRDCMAPSFDQWTTLFITTTTATMQSLLLQLAYVSCKFNEENKQQWLRSNTRAQDSTNGISVLMNILKQQQQQQQEKEEDTVLVKIQACRLISTLCRFDDFRTPSSNTSLPTTSCAHEAAMAFSKQHAVPILYSVVNEAMNQDTTTTLLEASLSALRVLAIQHDIVETMVQVGVLSLIQTLLVSYHSSPTILAATLGLIRNICANDAVKTKLCLQDGVLQAIVTAMHTFPNVVSIQEHACATMAQMALRQPHNSQVIVETVHGHLQIIHAMKIHSQHAVIQRQGALAIRNLASRSSPGGKIHQALLEAGAEQVLRQAGTHQSSVDEAYAALKELHCPVKVYKVTEQGKTLERTAMFGEGKLNFRPVLEESSGNTMD